MKITLAPGTYFIGGIDTGIGKTVVTGHIARHFLNQGNKVITQKLVQTGCTGIAEDIEEHRNIMGTGLLPQDIDGTTCPVVLPYPASPHFAAKLSNTTIDIDTIKNNTRQLQPNFDYLFVEGVGGLMVPLTNDYLSIDFVKDMALPLILVSSPRLGSLNHTFLSIEACLSRQINVCAIIYNYYGSFDKAIAQDSLNTIRAYVSKNLPDCQVKEFY